MALKLMRWIVALALSHHTSADSRVESSTGAAGNALVSSRHTAAPG